MESTPSLLAYLGAAAFIVSGCALVVLLLARRSPRPPDARTGQQLAAPPLASCTVCHKELTFGVADLRIISPQERGLVARARPDLVGKKLAEYICPHCEAAHCFVVVRARALWVGANFYEPQRAGAVCLECRKPLRKPPWKEGEYDGRLEAAPVLDPAYGLICSRCGALCCVACCAKMAHARTQDTRWVCPRCFRYPIEKVFHG